MPKIEPATAMKVSKDLCTSKTIMTVRSTTELLTALMIQYYLYDSVGAAKEEIEFGILC